MPHHPGAGLETNESNPGAALWGGTAIGVAFGLMAAACGLNPQQSVDQGRCAAPGRPTSPKRIQPPSISSRAALPSELKPSSSSTDRFSARISSKITSRRLEVSWA